MEEIKDFEGYLRRMQNGMDDKLWWVDKVDSKTIVDYGCADGTLLKHIREIHPNYTLIGVDINPDMLVIAQENVPDATFITVDEFFDSHKDYSGATLILSSVIHEIYSYCPDADEIIANLLSMGFDHIAIRDMFVKTDTVHQTIPIQIIDLLQKKTNKEMLTDFGECWGLPLTVKRLIHYLLKYRYVDNWEREVRENYLPIDIEPFVYMVSKYYNIEHFEHYTLPFIKDQIKKDIGLVLDVPTHAKILLTKKEL